MASWPRCYHCPSLTRCGTLGTCEEDLPWWRKLWLAVTFWHPGKSTDESPLPPKAAVGVKPNGPDCDHVWGKAVETETLRDGTCVFSRQCRRGCGVSSSYGVRVPTQPKQEKDLG